MNLNKAQKELILRSLRMYEAEYRRGADVMNNDFITMEMTKEADRSSTLRDIILKEPVLDDSTILEQDVLELLKDDYRIINAIKLYRERTGAYLKDAKLAVEAIRDKHGIVSPYQR